MFHAPVDDIIHALRHEGGASFGESCPDDLLHGIMHEAARLAEDVLAPINHSGDKVGAQFLNGAVTTPPGWREAYHAWRTGGWNGVVAPADQGGMDLPHLLNSACIEMWSGANTAFMLAPILTFGAIDALGAHGSESLQKIYLPKLISGEWTGTMNLTEPQAGSDLSALRTSAARHADGSYRITGQKIFITFGEHDLTDNIVHMVLARLSDAPAGTRGLSLFLVPKYLVKPDGSLGARNDVRCQSIEHKLGIHGSPTCTMIFGDDGGAIGYLIGEENRGLACMFTMMNNARLAVGLEGVGLCQRATQQAIEFSQLRRQGRAADAPEGTLSQIIEHVDVRRMLLTMQSLTMASRLICYRTAAAIDAAHRAHDPIERQSATERAGLLTPVAKAFSTDNAIEVASIGVQVHGGMGYIEETGAAQHVRDARITAIYEGTNGIQAIDLVMRKLTLSGGAALRAEIQDMRQALAQVRAADIPNFMLALEQLDGAVESFEQASVYLSLARPDEKLAGATAYLKLFGLVRGGVSLAHMAQQQNNARLIALARFFAEVLVSAAPSHAFTIMYAANSVTEAKSVF